MVSPNTLTDGVPKVPKVAVVEQVHQEAGLYGAQALPLSFFLQQHAEGLREAFEGGDDLFVHIPMLGGRLEDAVHP